MIIKILYFTACLFCFSLSSFSQAKTDIDRMNMKGKIKSICEMTGIVSDSIDFDKVIPSPFSPSRIIYFNEQGNKTEEIWYHNLPARTPYYIGLMLPDSSANADLIYCRWEYDYNSKNGLLESCKKYDREDSLLSIWEYTYDDKELLKNAEFKDCITSATVTESYLYNDKGLLTETTTKYNDQSNSSLKKSTLTNEYNDKSQLIRSVMGQVNIHENTDENEESETVESLFIEEIHQYKYDERGNKIYELREYEMGESEYYYTYDENNRLTSIKAPYTEDDIGFYLLTYAYDRHGNKLREQTESINDYGSTSNIHHDMRTEYSYSYNHYNDTPNWYKRIESKNHKPLYAIYREIEFYE